MGVKAWLLPAGSPGSAGGVWLTRMGEDQVRPPSSDCENAMLDRGPNRLSCHTT